MNENTQSTSNKKIGDNCMSSTERDVYGSIPPHPKPHVREVETPFVDKKLELDNHLKQSNHYSICRVSSWRVWSAISGNFHLGGPEAVVNIGSGCLLVQWVTMGNEVVISTADLDSTTWTKTIPCLHKSTRPMKPGIVQYFGDTVRYVRVRTSASVRTYRTVPFPPFVIWVSPVCQPIRQARDDDIVFQVTCMTDMMMWYSTSDSSFFYNNWIFISPDKQHLLL